MVWESPVEPGRRSISASRLRSGITILILPRRREDTSRFLPPRRGGLSLDDNEKQSVDKLLNLAKFAIIAMMVIGGYLGQSTLLGMF